MSYADYMGIVGAFLLLVKIVMHAVFMSELNNKSSTDDIGRFTNPIYFFPILDKVSGTLKTLKIIANVIYLVSVSLILFFLISNWTE